MSNERGTLAVRLLLSLVGLGIGVWGVLRFTGGNVHAGGIALYVAMVGIPFGLYVASIRTMAMSLTGGLALIGAVLLVQSYVTARWPVSSTAPAGYLYLLILGPFLVAAIYAADRLLRRS